MGRVLISLLIFAAGVTARAQSAPSESFLSMKRGTAIVLFSGVGGGILGLSTLSFYGQPEEHTSNITTGALVGVAAGLGYVLWSNSQEAPPARSWGWAPVNGGSAVTYHFEF